MLRHRDGSLVQVKLEVFETAAVAGRRMFEAVVELSSVDGSVTVDTNDAICSASESITKVLGYAPAELNGRPLKTCLLRFNIQEALSGGLWYHRATAQHKDGSIVSVQVRSRGYAHAWVCAGANNGPLLTTDAWVRCLWLWTGGDPRVAHGRPAALHSDHWSREQRIVHGYVGRDGTPGRDEPTRADAGDFAALSHVAQWHLASRYLPFLVHSRTSA